MKKLLFLLLVIPSLAFPNLKLAPPNIKIKNGRAGDAIFVDFISAHYQIEYDLKRRRAQAKSEITFLATENGYAIFDLVPNPTRILLNGMETESVSFSKDSEDFRYIKIPVKIGENTLIIENLINKNVRFGLSGVSSAFWMSDLQDRKYLEQYLPTNLEFDQYSTRLDILITGRDKKHEIFTNGEMKGSDNNITIEFPDYFTASSYFFHITPIKNFNKISGTYKSIDGRNIPILIYGREENTSYLNKTLEVLAELEKDYGPWPHPKVLIYAAGSGGMEYSGATITSFSALAHELTHSYFARGVMPARGNSGWIDEAIASWRDDGYSRRTKEELVITKMAGHSVYRRSTDRAAYSSGRNFIGFLDYKLNEKGGLKPFLKTFKDKWIYKPYLTMNFKKDLEEYFQEDLTDLFDKYIYGKGTELPIETSHEENPFHPTLSDRELEDLL